MRKKSDDETTPNDCGQKSGLMEYMYGESDAAGRAGFERHLSVCDSCREELTAFGRVRDDLSSWQIGFIPRTEVTLPRRGLAGLREMFAHMPVWARRTAMAGGAAALLFAVFSIAQTSFQLAGRDGLIGLGGSRYTTGEARLTSEEVDRLVQAAVERERTKLREENVAQMAALREQLTAEQKAQFQAFSAAQEAKLQSLKTGLKVELARTDRRNRNIRPFFASEDTADLWVTGR
jgi:hypothetical protein